MPQTREQAAVIATTVWPVAATGNPQPKPDAARVSPLEPARPSVSPVISDPAADRKRRRLLNLPVTVSVRLAEKRIEMAQILALTPGALITFNKPSEDLLDLYVNNRPFCRGEAVKIGEKFGLKISELQVRPTKRPRPSALT